MHDMHALQLLPLSRNQCTIGLDVKDCARAACTEQQKSLALQERSRRFSRIIDCFRAADYFSQRMLTSSNMLMEG